MPLIRTPMSMDGAVCCPWPRSPGLAWISAPQGVAPPVLVPGGHKKADQGHRHKTEHDAAEQRFDHGGNQAASIHNVPMGNALVASLLNQP